MQKQDTTVANGITSSLPDSGRGTLERAIRALVEEHKADDLESLKLGKRLAGRA